MKKYIALEGLDCAACADKIERAVAKLAHVESVRVNFFTQKMMLEAPEEQFSAVMKSARKAARKIESAFDFAE